MNQIIDFAKARLDRLRANAECRGWDIPANVTATTTVATYLYAYDIVNHSVCAGAMTLKGLRSMIATARRHAGNPPQSVMETLQNRLTEHSVNQSVDTTVIHSALADYFSYADITKRALLSAQNLEHCHFVLAYAYSHDGGLTMHSSMLLTDEHFVAPEQLLDHVSTVLQVRG